MTKRADRDYLIYMLSNAQAAIDFTENKTFQDIETNQLLALGLVKLIENIGESATKVSQEYQESCPQIPWREMIGMRNLLVHEFFNVDLKIVWQTIKQNLPLLIKELEKLPELKD